MLELTTTSMARDAVKLVRRRIPHVGWCGPPAAAQRWKQHRPAGTRSFASQVRTKRNRYGLSIWGLSNDEAHTQHPIPIRPVQMLIRKIGEEGSGKQLNYELYLLSI